jgi:ABC-type sugar transport system, periplasmic component
MFKSKKIYIFALSFFILVILGSIFTYVFKSSPSPEMKILTMTYSQKQALESDFIPEFKKKYPKLSIDTDYIIKDSDYEQNFLNLNKLINEYLKIHNADVLYGFPIEFLPDLIKMKDVISLDNFISKENYPIDRMQQGVLEQIKEASKTIGKSGIYALSPSFNNCSLMYNKSIFDEYTIKYPTNSMTWEEIFEQCNSIKSKVPNNMGILGFGPGGINGFFGEFNNIISPYRNDYVEHGKISINNNQNNHLWEVFTNAYKKYSMNIYDRSDFIKGYVAMRLIYPPELRSFNEEKSFFNLASDSEFRLVSVPEFKEYRGVGLLKVSDPIAIISKSTNKDLSWLLLSFACGKEYALHYITSENHSFTGGLISYYDEDIKNLIIKQYGFDFTPFYLTKGKLPKKHEIGQKQYIYIETLASEYMYKCLRENLPINEVLSKLENEVKVYLDSN